MAEKFTFPDQTGEDGPGKKKDDKLDIEIVDDTPEDDKNRKAMPQEVVDEIDKDDDLDEYSERVQSRLKALRKVYHDERRAKETAARERDEAARFAQNQLEENKNLKQRLSSGEKIYMTEMTASANSLLESARSKLKQANASGDSELITAAQEELTDAKLKVRDAQGFKPSLQENEKGVEGSQQVQNPARQVPNVDPKADAWRRKNGWFGVDKKMTALALGLHEELVESGVDPRSDKYYDAVDADMKKRFPEYFSEEDDSKDGKDPPVKDEPSSRKKPATVVASASRSTGPIRVKMSSSAAAIAKRLGITNEAYIREQMKLENK
jgi:hypothetical protein